MTCSCCAFANTADQHFNTEKVAKELRQYRRKGPGPTTRGLRDGLLATGLAQGTVPDIGGGLGILSLELLTEREGPARDRVVKAATRLLRVERDVHLMVRYGLTSPAKTRHRAPDLGALQTRTLGFLVLPCMVTRACRR